MTDETPPEGAPPPGPMIDPLPQLGSILNHMEAVMFSTGRVLEPIFALIEKNNLMEDELRQRIEEMYGAWRSYFALKDALRKAARDGQQKPS